ncbi:uncharacterized protein LOC113358943 [Papaver somniferum]|uniref:uncharacterized protein LOC113358943 n=1 Tax=Papaver somniferum TaxID=3469 RepID=UPI000E6F535C|nr:uncharacterized protein LOC113358943 [Papaver somniferum]
MDCSKAHPTKVISGPFNGLGVDFLIHGVEKPQTEVPDMVENVVTCTPGVGEDLAGLTVDLLNSVLLRQIPTTVSIPPPRRLHFSRTLKYALDLVIVNLNNIASWIQLQLLPTCTLSLYEPKSSMEERSVNRRKLQMIAINKALLCWKEQAALSSPDTLFELQQKHPPARLPHIPAEGVAATALSVSIKDVLLALKNFPEGTSCGRDGLRAQHLLDVMSGAGASVADELLVSITGVVNLWMAGKCPPILGDFVASSPLTPPLKPGGGLRPIIVGTIWRRLCSKLADTAACKEMTSYLGKYQFGVGIPCGGEGILHSANRLLELKGDDTSRVLLLIDFSNAFNLVDTSTIIREVRSRCTNIVNWVEFCYAKPARLYYQDSVLSPAQGVQQGDPLGPLLFALALHLLVEKIDAQCTLDLHAWYLDDDTIAGDTMEVSKDLKIIHEEGPSYGLHLNISKTEIFWPSYDPRRYIESAFPHNIGKHANGVKLLGGPVSLNSEFCSNMVLKRVGTTIQLMSKIQELQDPQFVDGAGFGLVQQMLANLPIKDGGLGVLTMADTVIHFGVVKEKIPTSYSLSSREATLWQCNRDEHAMDFLKVIPIPVLNQVVGPRQFSAILQYLLGRPFFEEDSLCSCCNMPMNIFGDHAIHCSSEVGLKFRHDLVKDVLADMCYKAGVAARKEVSLGFLSNTENELRPADIMVYNWEDGKDACMDVTGVSPFTSARKRNISPGHAIIAAITCKNKTYLDKCTLHAYGFCVLAFCTLGDLGVDTISFLRRLRNYMARHDANFKLGNSFFYRLGIVIQKGVGAQLVVRLPTIPCNLYLVP